MKDHIQDFIVPLLHAASTGFSLDVGMKCISGLYLWKFVYSALALKSTEVQKFRVLSILEMELKVLKKKS